MSDFFSGIYGGAHGPDVVMNEGPLPPTSSAGMPPGFNGTPDAKIDYSSSLLGDMQPYAYSEPGRLSTQAAYLNIPHVAQRIVPQINLPDQQPQARGGGFMGVNHQVDDGDVAFVVRAMFSPFDLVSDKKKYNRQGILYAIDPVVNLATTNYILHGLQRYGFDSRNARNWSALWAAFGIDAHFQSLMGDKLSVLMQNAETIIDQQTRNPTDRAALEAAQHKMCFYRKRLAQHVVTSLITPFGIPRGSERQGGQHQGIVNRSVTNPVDFVTALVVDGKAINLANFWRNDDISAGDDLCLFLEDRDYVRYTLSNNPRSRRTVNYEPLRTWSMETGVVGTGRDCNPKYVSVRNHAHGVYEAEALAGLAGKLAARKAALDGSLRAVIEESRKRRRDGQGSVGRYASGPEPIFQLVPGVASSPHSGMRGALWHDGYWHIARSQVMQFSHDIKGEIPNGDVAATSGKLLEVTFAPVWVEPLESGVPHGVAPVPAKHRAVRTGGGGGGGGGGIGAPPPPIVPGVDARILAARTVAGNVSAWAATYAREAARHAANARNFANQVAAWVPGTPDAKDADDNAKYAETNAIDAAAESSDALARRGEANAAATVAEAEAARDEAIAAETQSRTYEAAAKSAMGLAKAVLDGVLALVGTARRDATSAAENARRDAGRVAGIFGKVRTTAAGVRRLATQNPTVGGVDDQADLAEDALVNAHEANEAASTQAGEAVEAKKDADNAKTLAEVEDELQNASNAAAGVKAAMAEAETALANAKETEAQARALVAAAAASGGAPASAQAAEDPDAAPASPPPSGIAEPPPPAAAAPPPVGGAVGSGGPEFRELALLEAPPKASGLEISGDGKPTPEQLARAVQILGWRAAWAGVIGTNPSTAFSPNDWDNTESLVECALLVVGLERDIAVAEDAMGQAGAVRADTEPVVESAKRVLQAAVGTYDGADWKGAGIQRDDASVVLGGVDGATNKLLDAVSEDVREYIRELKEDLAKGIARRGELLGAFSLKESDVTETLNLCNREILALDGSAGVDGLPGTVDDVLAAYAQLAGAIGGAKAWDVAPTKGNVSVGKLTSVEMSSDLKNNIQTVLEKIANILDTCTTRYIDKDHVYGDDKMSIKPIRGKFPIQKALPPLGNENKAAYALLARVRSVVVAWSLLRGVGVNKTVFEKETWIAGSLVLASPDIAKFDAAYDDAMTYAVKVGSWAPALLACMCEAPDKVVGGVSSARDRRVATEVIVGILQGESASGALRGIQLHYGDTPEGRKLHALHSRRMLLAVESAIVDDAGALWVPLLSALTTRAFLILEERLLVNAGDLIERAIRRAVNITVDSLGGEFFGQPGASAVWVASVIFWYFKAIVSGFPSIGANQALEWGEIINAAYANTGGTIDLGALGALIDVENDGYTSRCVDFMATAMSDAFAQMRAVSQNEDVWTRVLAGINSFIAAVKASEVGKEDGRVNFYQGPSSDAPITSTGITPFTALAAEIGMPGDPMQVDSVGGGGGAPKPKKFKRIGGRKPAAPTG